MSQAQVNIFLKIKLTKGGLVKGSATAKGHEQEMLIDTIRWGEENSAAIGGKGGSVTVRNFEFTKRMCIGSIPLLLGCAGSDVVKEAVISLRGTNVAEKEDFLKWTLEDGVISLYETEAATGGGFPLERVRIRFRSLGVEFKPRDDEGKLGGTMTARIDVGANTASA
jgi:type VI protein secretion system component Hcp